MRRATRRTAPRRHDAGAFVRTLSAAGWDARARSHAFRSIAPPAALRIADRDPRPVGAPDASGHARVRWSLVTRARARIGIGYYDRPRVRIWIADALLREFLQRV